MAADEALSTIEQTLAHEEGLRSRTEGLTWMIWGLVTAGWTLTYDAVAWISRPGVPSALLNWVWLPWVVVGGAVVTALWRTAALADPALEDDRPAGALVVAGWTGFVIALWAALFFGLVGGIGFPGTADTMGLIVLGVTWFTFGAVRPVRLTDRGGRVCMLVGLGLFVAGMATAFALGHEHPDANAISTVVATLVGGLVPLGGGLWQALRG